MIEFTYYGVPRTRSCHPKEFNGLPKGVPRQFQKYQPRKAQPAEIEATDPRTGIFSSNLNKLSHLDRLHQRNLVR